MAWLELDLDALTANLAAVRSIVGADTAVHPVVKADAYGHGALPITRALEAAGADGFCVAALDEALALRDGGILAPIRVLYPIPPELAGWPPAAPGWGCRRATTCCCATCSLWLAGPAGRRRGRRARGAARSGRGTRGRDRTRSGRVPAARPARCRAAGEHRPRREAGGLVDAPAGDRGRTPDRGPAAPVRGSM
ncbi:MAG: alanine racemase [Candidatus Limnocylindrales bacterium]